MHPEKRTNFVRPTPFFGRADSRAGVEPAAMFGQTSGRQRLRIVNYSFPRNDKTTLFSVIARNNIEGIYYKYNHYVPVNSNCDYPPGELPGFDQILITHRREFDANLSPLRRAFDSVCGRTKLVGGCPQKIHNGFRTSLHIFYSSL